MRVWKLESFARHTTPSGAPLYIAARAGESRPSLYKRAKAALGLAGRRYQAYSDHSEVFYIKHRGYAASARAELVEVEEPSGEVWREFIAAELGTSRWCVAPRMTARLAEKYDRAVSQPAFNDLKAKFITKTGVQNG